MELEQYNIVDMQTLRKLGFPDYYQTIEGLASALDASEPYNHGRPDIVPGGDLLRQCVTTMKDLGVGADRGDTYLKEQRQQQRIITDLHVESSVSYMKVIAINLKDPSLLHTMRLPLKDLTRSAPPRINILPEAVPIEAQAKYLKGENGAFALQCNHVRNGGPYLVNLCKGRPQSEDDWYNPGGRYSSCKEIIFRGMERANEYFARIRTDGPNGPGPWSNVVSIIIL